MYNGVYSCCTWLHYSMNIKFGLQPQSVIQSNVNSIWELSCEETLLTPPSCKQRDQVSLSFWTWREQLQLRL